MTRTAWRCGRSEGRAVPIGPIRAPRPHPLLGATRLESRLIQDGPLQPESTGGPESVPAALLVPVRGPPICPRHPKGACGRPGLAGEARLTSGLTFDPSEALPRWLAAVARSGFGLGVATGSRSGGAAVVSESPGHRPVHTRAAPSSACAGNPRRGGAGGRLEPVPALDLLTICPEKVVAAAIELGPTG